MKHRVLFVDDEPLVLQGLRRMLHGMRSEWEMEFVESGRAALDLVAQRPFDAVVTDMQMPGMNGAELLGEVLKRNPQAVRLVLSGHVDQDLIYRCIGTSHQCLSKPCDAQTLKRTVQRAIQLTGPVKSESVKRLVARMDRLPTMPAVYSELVKALQSPDTDIEDIAAVVKKDPGLTAKLLKLVNSAFFGSGRKVSNASEAVACLGVETVKSLALSINAFSHYESTEPGGVSLSEVWQHSLRTAEIARVIAREERLPMREADEAFAGALLHDAGRVVLACNAPREYREACELARQPGGSILAAEEQVFACTHADVGAYLLGLWGLPDAVVEVIALHHAPSLTPEKAFNPLAVVHVANVLAHEGASGDVTGAGVALDEDYVAAVGLTDRVAGWREAVMADTEESMPV